MADTKISALANGTPALATDRFPIARAGANYYLTPANILSYGTSPITGTTITATTRFLAPGDGTSTTTGYGFASNANYGFDYNSGTGRLWFSINTAVPTALTSTGVFQSSTGGVRFTTGTNAATDGTTDLHLTRYAAKQLKISGDGNGLTDQAGLILGYSALSGAGGIWPTVNRATPDSTNFALLVRDSFTNINAGTSSDSTAQVLIGVGSGGTKVVAYAIAGKGIDITAGTATTDVQAISATQTWNNAGVTFTGYKFSITDQAANAGSAAASIHTNWLGGVAGVTSLMSLSKTGVLTVTGGATFLTTSSALTNGAGASAGTITNAPSVGNPTKWIGINDNGTTRYIPAW